MGELGLVLLRAEYIVEYGTQLHLLYNYYNIIMESIKKDQSATDQLIKDLVITQLKE